MIIGIIGGTGWYVWKAQKSNQQPGDATQPTSSSQKKKDTNNNEQTQKPAQKYLEIKELGIKLKLTDSISNIYYVLRKDSLETDVQYVEIFDKDIDNLKNAKGESCKNPNFPIAIISRISHENYKKRLNEGYQENTIDMNFPEEFSFDKQNRYGAVGWHQSGPLCVIHPLDTGNEIIAIYMQKKNDILKAYKLAEAL